MAVFLYTLLVLVASCWAAPPKAGDAPAQSPARQPAPAPHSAQIQQANPLDYYLDHPELRNYYSQQQRQEKKGASGGNPGQSSKLETLEPDSEVELIPGAQQPQQPPQQPPIAPNLPGLIPGQRVFIVHMPIPGYRPGTIGGYQPVYIVAAAPQAPQGNIGFAAPNGYHNAVLLDPTYQVAPQIPYRQPTNLLAYNPVAPGYNAPGPAWWQHVNPAAVGQQAGLRIQPAKLQASAESLSDEQN